jgi:DNA-binding transcriptional regulator YdaS (Cro superfamily)
MITPLFSLIDDVEYRNRLARQLRCSPDYLWQIATAWRGKRASPELAKRIESATGGKVTRADLRPDLWAEERRAA